MQSVKSAGLLLLREGTRPLEEPPNATHRRTTIVAVHGLNGHRVASWTDEESEVMWLTDLLPSYIPDARVMTFGYELEADLSLASIDSLASSLLKALAEEKDLNGRRDSLVFVGHDIGGVIIKQALLIANAVRDYSVVAEITSLLVFFSVPGRIRDSASCESFLCNLIHATRYRCRANLSTVLSKLSRALIAVSREYYSIAAIYTTCAFHETEGAHSVFGGAAATLGVSNEKVHRLDSSHSQICRISSASNPAFARICESIRGTSNPDALYLNCLQTLSALEWRILGYSPPLVVSDAFAWIRTNHSYTTWLSNPKVGTLRVAGQSGTEIAALAASVMTTLWHDKPDRIVLYFSFDLRNPSQCTTDTMFLSLIRQLLLADPSCFLRVSHLYKLITAGLGWSLEGFWAFFRSLIQIPRQEPIFCIIDGVNKCNPAWNHWLGDFLSLASLSGSRIKLLLADTDMPSGSVTSGSLIQLEHHDEPREQLEKFVRTELEELIYNDPSFADFEEAIRDRLLHPESTFLSARLCFKWLRDLDLRSTPSSMAAGLKLIPHSLDCVYRVCVLPVLAQTHSPWFRDALRLIVFALRPLKVSELSTSLAIAWENQGLVFSSENVPRNLAKDLERAFGDLIIIENDEVLLAHSSIQQLLYEARAEWDIGSGVVGHAQIARMCIEYLLHIQVPNLRVRINDTPQLPGFLTYAARYWAQHYNLMERSTVRDQNLQKKARQLLDDAPRMRMCFWVHWERGYQPLAPTTAFTDPLLIAAKLGLDDILLTELGKLQNAPERESLVLDIASERDNEHIVDVLVKKVASAKKVRNGLHLAAQRGNPRIVNLFLNAGVAADLRDDTSSTPLHLAARSGYRDVVLRLLAVGADVNAVDMNNRTALHLSAEYGHAHVVDALLAGKANTDVVDRERSTPLHLATRSGQLKVINVLLSASAQASVEDMNSYTPLHIAALHGLVEPLRLLREMVNKETKDGKTALHLAAENNHRASVEELLMLEADPEAGTGSNVGTPLHLAARKGLSDIAGILLKYESNPDATNDEEQTPLHLAATNGHGGVIDQLLDAGGDPGAVDVTSATPLHLAAREGHCGSLVRIINRYSSPVDVLDEFEFSPLHNAALRGVLDGVRILLDAGANIDTGGLQGAPLHVAIRNNQPQVASYLLEQGASTNIPDGRGRRPLHAAAEVGNGVLVGLLVESAEVDGIDYAEVTPLMLAAERGRVEAVRLLLGAGADVIAGSSEGLTPLHFAARSGHSEVVDVILEHLVHHMAHQRQGTRAKDNKGRIPLHLAAKNGHTGVVAKLLSLSGDRQAKSADSRGRTPLHHAAKHGQAEVVKQLLAKGASAVATDSQYLTPLHLASSGGHLETVAILLEETRDPDGKDEDARTALHWASQSGHTAVARLLLDHGANMHLVTKEGQSLLHFAAESGNLEMVQQLLESGFDINEANRDAETPLALAAANGHLEIVEALVNAGSGALDMDGKNGQSPLSLAAKKGYIAIVEKLLKAGARPDGNVEEASESGATDSPLIHAAQYGHLEVVRLLVKAGAALNYENQDGKTPFFFAVKQGYEDIVKELLEAGVDINAMSVWPPMYTAAYFGQAGLILLFIEMGFDIERPGPNGWTPLHAAYDSSECSQILLENKAERDPETRDGWTPLHLAAYSACHDTISVLLMHGADPLKQNERGDTAFHLLMADEHEHTVRKMLNGAPPNLDIKNVDGCTPLWVAVANKSEKIVSLLLMESEVDVDQQVDGTTLVEQAAELKNTTIIKMLVEANADIRTLAPSLLRLSARTGDQDLFKALLEKGANPLHADDYGWTAEMHASAAGHDGILQILHETSLTSVRRSGMHAAIGPTALSGKNRTENCELAERNLVVQHMPSAVKRRAGVRANFPIPPQLGPFYFEVEILECPEGGAVGVGVCMQDTPLNLFPGWSDNSWGYHTDDGRKYHDNYHHPGEVYGERARAGDVVGCRVDLDIGELSFNRGSTRFGIAFTDVKGCLFPVVAMDTPGTRLRVNFGADPLRYWEP